MGETTGAAEKNIEEGLGNKKLLLLPMNGLIMKSLNPNRVCPSAAGKNIPGDIAGKFAGAGDKIPGI